jgi:hypothetical protein
MKKSRFTEEQIAHALRPADGGTAARRWWMCAGRSAGRSKRTSPAHPRHCDEPPQVRLPVGARHAQARRLGWAKKRVYQLYRLEGVQLRMKVERRKRDALLRGKVPKPTGRTSTGASTSCTTNATPAASSAY